MENKFLKCVKTLTLEFPSSMENIEDAVRTTSAFVSSLSKNIDAFGLKLVLSEGITNAVVHGNKENSEMSATVCITLTPELLTIQITDAGPGFNWKDKLGKDLEKDLESESGRGLALIHAFGYEVEFNDAGNIVTMFKALE